MLGRQNKKTNIAVFHKEIIMNAAEKLFLENGVDSTTIEDISKMSKYSRRTLYAYYEGKQDILHHIILKGLKNLKTNLIDAINLKKSFIEQYWEICKSMEEYQTNSPQSVSSINQMKSEGLDYNFISPIVTNIFELGTEINNLLANYIEQGKSQGIVHANVESMKTVYIIWGGISSLLSLVQNKGIFLEKEFNTTKDSFLEYGYKQIINSILVERIL